MYHIFCIHSSVEGYLDSFLLLAIINKAAMNIVELVSLLRVRASSEHHGLKLCPAIGLGLLGEVEQGSFDCSYPMPAPGRCRAMGSCWTLFSEWKNSLRSQGTN